MAVTVNWDTGVISVPQADLTFVSGTLYEMDMDWFRTQLNALQDDADGMPFGTTHIHNTEVTIVGTTFARQVILLAPYSVTFTPDTQWSVRLVNANTNIFDVEGGFLNQNQVQVIPGNSGGLVGSSVINLIKKVLVNRLDTDGVTGEFKLYDDDDVTVLIKGNIWEDVGGTTAYDGTNPINRRDRLV
jgi:hypothetical protein